MDKYVDWIKKLEDDLIEQFKGKPNIQVFNKAVARQLEELYAFFYELSIMQWLDQAEGAQLDGIGNIVDLSRTDALIWSNLAGINVPMDDGLYRMYLLFKIFLNTSEATYKDIVRTLRMFWPDSPIYYSEHIDIPATMFFTTAPMAIDTDMRVLQIATRVKAAGVALHFIIPTPVEEDVVEYHATAGSVWIRLYIVCDTPEISADVTERSATAAAMFTREYIIADNDASLSGEITVTDTATVGGSQTIKEVHKE